MYPCTMTKPMISDEAVAAAHMAMLGRYLNKANIKRMLEAAAPHMLAEFEKQRKYAALDAISELGSDDPDENPYRSQS